jgi:hypothetical protein
MDVGDAGELRDSRTGVRHCNLLASEGILIVLFGRWQATQLFSNIGFTWS